MYHLTRLARGIARLSQLKRFIAFEEINDLDQIFPDNDQVDILAFKESYLVLAPRAALTRNVDFRNLPKTLINAQPTSPEVVARRLSLLPKQPRLSRRPDRPSDRLFSDYHRFFVY